MGPTQVRVALSHPSHRQRDDEVGEALRRLDVAGVRVGRARLGHELVHVRGEHRVRPDRVGRPLHHLGCHGTRYVRHARGWHAYGGTHSAWGLGASSPVPPVRTARRPRDVSAQCATVMSQVTTTLWLKRRKGGRAKFLLGRAAATGCCSSSRPARAVSLLHHLSCTSHHLCSVMAAPTVATDQNAVLAKSEGAIRNVHKRAF